MPTIAAEFGTASATLSARLRVTSAGGSVYYSSAFQIVVVT